MTTNQTLRTTTMRNYIPMFHGGRPCAVDQVGKYLTTIDLAGFFLEPEITTSIGCGADGNRTAHFLSVVDDFGTLRVVSRHS